MDTSGRDRLLGARSGAALVLLAALLVLAPAARAQSPAVPDQVWIGEDGQPVAIPGSALVEAIRAGRIGDDTLVWLPGMEGWAPAASVPGVAAHLPRQPPPLPAPEMPAEVTLGPMVVTLGPTADSKWLVDGADGTLAVTNSMDPGHVFYRAIFPHEPLAAYRLGVTVSARDLGAHPDDLAFGAGLFFDGGADPRRFQLFLAGPDGRLAAGRFEGEQLRFPSRMTLGDLAGRDSVRLEVEREGNSFRFQVDGRNVMTIATDSRRGDAIGIAATGHGRFTLSDFRYEPL
jgi:hypothetical protein